MIPPFSFKAVPEIIFGHGSIGKLVNQIQQSVKTVLLITGRKSFTESKHYEILVSQIAENRITCHCEAIDSEPTPQIINDIVHQNVERSIDLVIAIGGGSCLDAGKAIAAMLIEEGDITDYLEGVGHKNPSGDKVVFYAVPTTSGTGSESTANAVIRSVGTDGFKKSLRHKNYIPNLALIDPELTVGCPPEITAACGMDCFTQLLEAYLSTKSSPLTDALALEGLKAVERSLLSCYRAGDNLDARGDLSYAALLSGIVLTSAGLGTVHGFASGLGGLYPVPHGIVCGTLMAPANELTLRMLKKNPGNGVALGKYSKLGLLFSKKDNQTESWYQDYFIEALWRFTEELKIPKLSTFGIPSSDIERIVSIGSNKYNPYTLGKEHFREILTHRI